MTDFCAQFPGGEHGFVYFCGKTGLQGQNRMQQCCQLPDRGFSIILSLDITDMPREEVSSLMPPRSLGRVRLSTKPGVQGTMIDGFRQSGSYKCLFPRTSGAALEAVLVNTSGGVTGGDRFDCAVSAGVGTRTTLTTQACERAYRAMPDQIGKVTNWIQAAATAHVNWLPQETILFDGCALDRSLSVDLAEDATFLMVEPLIFGRAAMGEVLADVHLRDRISIRRSGVPIYMDALQFSGDLNQHMAQGFVGGGAGAMASVVYVAPNAESHLEAIREDLPDTAGASLLRDDVLVMRLLSQDSFILRRTLLPVLRRLSGANLPRCWTL